MRIVRMLVLIYSIIPIPAIGQEKLEIGFNPESEAAYTLSMNMSQDVTQTVDNEKQNLHKDMLLVWDYKILGKQKSGETDVRLSYERVKMSQNYGFQTVEYDSENPPTFLDPSMKSLASLPGTELEIRLTPGGKVLRIHGVDEMLNKMIKSMELPDNPQKDAVISDLKKQFGEEALKQTLEQILAFYPDKPIAVGEKWTKTQEITSGFPMRILSEYTLKSRSGGTAGIDVLSDVKSDSLLGKISMGELTMQYDIEGSQEGTISVNEATGIPLRFEQNLHFDGTVTVSGVSDEGPRSWPISSVGSVAITFQKR